MKIIIPEQVVEIPDGNRCVSWSIKENQDGTTFQCSFYTERKNHYSGNDYITIMSCAHFHSQLGSYKYGDGVYKLEECLKLEVK